MTTAAVVVSYNRLDLLKACVGALLDQTTALDEIIVVDNGSTDGSREYLASLRTRVTTVLSADNGGGAGGFTQGIELAMRNGHDHGWLMDDDARPALTAHAALRTAVDTLTAAGLPFSFLASKVVDDDFGPIESHTPAALPGGDAPYPRINHCSFVGAYISLAYSRETALPIRQFFIYHDDFEYTSRLTRSAPGYRVDESFVHHPNKVYHGDIGFRVLFDIRNRLWIQRCDWMSAPELRDEFAGNLMRRTVGHARLAADKKVFLRSAARGWYEGLRSKPPWTPAPRTQSRPTP